MRAGGLIGAALTFTAISRGTAPQGAPIRIDDATGRPEPAEPAARPAGQPPGLAD